MSLNAKEVTASATIKLTDATQYKAWMVWAIGLFMQERLLCEVKKTMPHYPQNSTNTLKSDQEWWDRKTKEATIKALKDDGLVRPPIRIAEVFDASTTTLDKKAFELKEKAAVKNYETLLANYVKVYNEEHAKFKEYLMDEKKHVCKGFPPLPYRQRTPHTIRAKTYIVHVYGKDM